LEQQSVDSEKLVRRYFPACRRRARPIFTIAAPILLVPLLLGFASQTVPRTAQVRAIPGASDRASLLYADAASAVRSKDCAGAFKILAPLTGDRGAEGSFARLLSGFYAHSCEQVGVAEDRLFNGADPDGVLEDWRLYILSDTATARGHVLVAQNALAKLLGDYPGSLLRPRALVKAASLAWQRGDARRALELIGQGRRESIQGAEATQLERLAWEIGTRLPDDAIRREAGRRLLTDSPAAAAEMQVAEIFRPASGTLAWSSILTPEQLARRARALLALKLETNAAAALDAVPAASRDLDWTLLRAEILTRLHQGAEALSLLAPRTAEGRQAAALEWERAQAAADVATALRGRSNRPSPERQRMRLLSRQYLAKVAQLGAAPDLSVKALRSLYADQVDDGLFDESIKSLGALRRLDPLDTTGAANLWSQGWREYGKKNYSGAVGYWTELFSLYPEDSAARRGRYWSARAFEALGESERAQQIFREVAASDTTDFYRKNALARLQKKPVSDHTEPAAVEAWPNDPVLTRARLLTDLGLDDLAGSELELARAKAQPRSVRALEALILARRGDRRKSVLAIREAFPALGGAWQARLPEDARRLYYPLDYQEPIRNWATQNRLPPYLVFGIIRQESAFDTNAQSWAGARGLMQLMPSTAKELAGKLGLPYTHDKLSDPEFNVRLGTHYFSHVLGLFDGNVDLALAGYNGGPYRIKRMWNEWKAGGVGDMDRFLEGLNLEESKTYVKRILVLSDSYRQLYPLPG
jgi:soluble lytic murein transglycosylase-like protein